MTSRRSTPKTPEINVDYGLMVVLLGLSALSLLAIYGALPLLPYWRSGIDLIVKQVIWIIIAVVLLAGLIWAGIDRLFTGAIAAYWILMGLLVLLLVDKYAIDLPLIAPVNGTTAWITLPGLGTLQPSEFMKIVVLILCANIIHQHNEQKRAMSYAEDLRLFVKILSVALPPLVLIVAQPDTGIPIVMIIGIAVMLGISGIRREWILYSLIGVIAGIGLLLFLFFNFESVLINLVGASYRLNRVYGWLRTEEYISSYGLQLYQSLLAVGSAGWLGHGLQSVVVSLIEPQNDFIFAVFAQNFGFIGASVLLLLEMLLDLKIAAIALSYKKRRERYLIAGVLGMLLFQQIQNMGMIIGLTPITGITLPFVSAGGSSLLSFVPALAVLFVMSHRIKSKRTY